MTRFLSTIILISLAAFSQSKIIFVYTTTEAMDQTPATFSVGVDFEETDFSDFSVKEMKPRADPQPLESAGEFHLTLDIIYLTGELTVVNESVCNILLESGSNSGRKISQDYNTPEEAVIGMNSSLDSFSLSEGMNFKSSFAVGDNSVQLNVKRAHSELAQAITDANCETINVSYNLLI